MSNDYDKLSKLADSLGKLFVYTYNCPDGTVMYSLHERYCPGEYHFDSVEIVPGATYTVCDIAEKCKRCPILYKPRK